MKNSLLFQNKSYNYLFSNNTKYNLSNIKSKDLILGKIDESIETHLTDNLYTSLYYDKNNKNIMKNLEKLKEHHLYISYKKNIEKGLQHPAFYKIMDQNDLYIELGFTNLTKSNKPIYLKTKEPIEIHQIGDSSLCLYQGVPQVWIIFKIRKEFYSEFVKSYEKDPLKLNKYGGENNIMEMKNNLIKLFQEKNLEIFYQEIKILGLLNIIEESIDITNNDG